MKEINNKEALQKNTREEFKNGEIYVPHLEKDSSKVNRFRQFRKRFASGT